MRARAARSAASATSRTTPRSNPNGGRIYDQLASQFLTADPVMQAPFFTQGLNRYAYAFNDPVNNVDPSGFSAFNDTNADVTTGIMGWGGGVVGAAYISGGIASGNFGGLASGGISLASGGLHAQAGAPALQGLGSAGGRFNAAAPSAAPASGGGQNTMSATGENRGAPSPTPKRPHWGERDPVLCGQPGAPTCGPSPSTLTEMDRVARKFIMDQVRESAREGVEFGTSIEEDTSGSLKPHEVNRGDSDSVTISSSTEHGRALAHLHLGTASDELATFSGQDINAANRAANGLGQVSYVSINNGQYILKYDPQSYTITRLPGVWGQMSGSFVPAEPGFNYLAAGLFAGGAASFAVVSYYLGR